MKRVLLFVLLCVAAGSGVVAYALFSTERVPGPKEGAASHVMTEDPVQRADVRNRPHLLFRNTALGTGYGCLAVVALDAPAGARHLTKVPCERVYASGGIGMCLQAARGVFTTFRAVSFDRDFQVGQAFKLPGTPSRTRVSRDSKFAATTVFVRGDSYNSGGFSTRTNIIDLIAAKVVGDLEEFQVLKDGEAFKKADFNFWGVTFSSDSDRFHATLGTSGKLYLVSGRTSTRTVEVVREGVECPSLSPDETRIAFKSRTMEGGRMVWRIRVMDLKTRVETRINEQRSVDDQVEWFDNERLLYALPRSMPGSATSDIWIARADGAEASKVFLSDGFSPCVVRPH